jgi:adenosylcobinamide kinase / adenosylcobinamide-phosphate guanylyltransferase
MADIILVTGGARSGKSCYAQERTEQLEGRKLFIATCPRIDSEMDERIDRHIADRKDRNWHTIEEEIDISRIIRNNYESDIILLDCLTLWVNNLLYTQQNNVDNFTEEQIATLCQQLIEISIGHPGTIFFVTNEIGSGIVPENSSARRYRDLVGRCNQSIAQMANEVVLVSCGIPLTLKSNY